MIAVIFRVHPWLPLRQEAPQPPLGFLQGGLGQARQPPPSFGGGRLLVQGSGRRRCGGWWWTIARRGNNGALRQGLGTARNTPSDCHCRGRTEGRAYNASSKPRERSGLALIPKKDRNLLGRDSVACETLLLPPSGPGSNRRSGPAWPRRHHRERTLSRSPGRPRSTTRISLSGSRRGS